MSRISSRLVTSHLETKPARPSRVSSRLVTSRLDLVSSRDFHLVTGPRLDTLYEEASIAPILIPKISGFPPRTQYGLQHHTVLTGISVVICQGLPVQICSNVDIGRTIVDILTSYDAKFSLFFRQLSKAKHVLRHFVPIIIFWGFVGLSRSKK